MDGPSIRMATSYLADPRDFHPWIQPPKGSQPQLPWQPMQGVTPDRPLGVPAFHSSPLFIEGMKKPQRVFTCAVVHDAWIVAYLDKEDHFYTQMPVMNYDVVCVKEVISAYVNIHELKPYEVQHFTDNLLINNWVHEVLKEEVADAEVTAVSLEGLTKPYEYTKIAAHWLAVEAIFDKLFKTYIPKKHVFYKLRVSALRALIRNSDVTLDMPPTRLSL